jgi:arabinose operon protein AraL
MSNYDELQGFLIDLDGPVWKEMKLIEGAAETIQALQSDRKRVVSNRGTYSREKMSNLLFEKGVHLDPQDIILTSHVVAEYLRKNYPYEPVRVLGESGLEEELLNSGVLIAINPNNASWLVFSLHIGVTCEDLNQAFRAVLKLRCQEPQLQ